MTRRKCLYIVTPADFVFREDIPDNSPVYRRYLKLMARAWEETGPQYEHAILSNAELARLWNVNEETARKCLAEMRDLKLIKTQQIDQTRRIIYLMVAWRGQGKDSAEDINATSARAPRLEAQAPASRVPTQPRKLRNEFTQGGHRTTTLDGDPNRSVVVGTNTQVPANKTTTVINARLREIFEIAGVNEPALSELAVTVKLDTSRDWCLWTQRAPKSFTDPVSFMVKSLLENPRAVPPSTRTPGRHRSTIAEDLAAMRAAGIKLASDAEDEAA